VTALTAQPWFWPAMLVVFGLPLVLVLLNEIYNALVRRSSVFAKPVGLLRNWVLPAFAVYLLIDQLQRSGASGPATWSKVAATVFGFLLILFVLSGANAALFGGARAGSWRERLPGIFVDLGRLVLIIVGLALLLSWVWGANLGGLIAAVGVGSIVIGLAVQNAVGPVISGLLLLFERPFGIGDWLDTKFGKGRVVEVNWRAVHIDTENGIRVVPNAALASDPFVNLSKTVAPYFKAKAFFDFAAEDPPGLVKSTLLSVAEGLPTKLPGAAPLVTPLGPHPDQPSIDKYRINIPVTSPAEADGTVSTMTYRTWYAAQRVGLHLNNVKHGGKKNTADIAERLQSVVTGLGLGPEAYATMSANARLLQFAEGETVQHRNTIPAAVGFITEGRVEMLVQADDGRQVRLGTLGIGDYLGATAVTRQRGIVAMVALTDVAIVAVPWEAMEQVVRTDHRFARQIGDTIDMRRNAAKEALAQAAQTAIG
jgi:small-conductance mechanosensitive channel